MVTSYSCPCSSTIVMKNCTINTPIEFLSLNLSTLKPHKPLQSVSPIFLSLKNCSFYTHTNPYRYKRKPKKKGLKNAVTHFESRPEAAASKT